MKISDEVYVHGYIDEIRNDVIIIRNEGGYFGTVPSEVVDQEPSKRPTGHWIEHDDERVLCECSECHEKYLLYEEHVLGRNFCPNCGCAMKGGEEE